MRLREGEYLEINEESVCTVTGHTVSTEIKWL